MTLQWSPTSTFDTWKLPDMCPTSLQRNHCIIQYVRSLVDVWVWEGVNDLEMEGGVDTGCVGEFGERVSLCE